MKGKRLLYGIPIVLGLVAVSVLRAGSVFNFGVSPPDEHFIVPIALGFLDGDLNPRWFFYHTLPMYILGLLYLFIYWGYLLLGLVATKVEFASLIFFDETMFYVSARLLFSAVHTAACFWLALIIRKYYRSLAGAVLFFLAAMTIPDSVSAANYIRVDTFVFFFLVSVVYFGCYAEKTRASFFLALASLAGAMASKLPALVFLPVLLLQVAYDVKRGLYPGRYLAYAAAVPFLFFVLFMPYAVLDFDSYKAVLYKAFAIASEERLHIGKEHLFTFGVKLQNILVILQRNVGYLSVILALSALFVGFIKDKRLIFVGLFSLSYTVAFLPSAWVDDYWLRPAFPLCEIRSDLVYELN